MQEFEMKKTVKQIGKKVVAGAIAVAVLLFLLILNPFVKIDAGERGVVLNFGAVQNEVLGEGLHLRIPIMQKIVKMDVKIQKSETRSEAASKDLQDIKSLIALNYHIVPDKANWVYQNVGVAFKERIIDPNVQEAVKAVTARYTAVQLISEREAVSTAIKDTLSQKLADYNLFVDGFSVIDFSFSKKFTDAIESKQEAEQFALRAQRDLDRIKIEAEQKIAQAKAEAESLRLQKGQITTEMIELRKIEAMREAIAKWNGTVPNVLLSGGGATPLLSLEGLMKK
ncbi:MAG TPA: HflC protein [Deltaproteobacteria bacterium]|nr:MAG: HflC protein [Deltaproteobacteria bacterium GWC2_65_14]HBO68929.1 HflC protein [Deltaproteobacteria bacterium]